MTMNSKLMVGNWKMNGSLAANQQLIEEFKLTQDQVATRVGKSRSSIANTMRLLQLPTSIQRLLGEGQLSAGHARALLGTPDRAFQEKLAKAIVSEKLTVREVEDRVREHGGAPEPEETKGTTGGTKPLPVVRAAPLLELEEMLSEHLDTRVAVSMGQRKGRIVIDFSTLEDLERVYRVIVDGKEPTD